MKPALQALLIANDVDMQYRTLSGLKQITIREGRRGYQPGPVMIGCIDNSFVVMADIVDVRQCLLMDVTENEWVADGFNTQADLLKGLRRYYRDLTLTSPVTIVRWENVRGDLGRLFVYLAQLRKARAKFTGDLTQFEVDRGYS